MSKPQRYSAPFPWFGGKSRVAPLVWEALGTVRNYVEPFFGSGAVLLAAPNPAPIETVNDADGLLANFWRAVKLRPEEVAEAADYPVSEVDLLARHRELVARRDELTSQLKADVTFCDPGLAGMWVWGACAWIGSGWGHSTSPQLPHLGDAGMGINRKLPHLGDAGMGINRGNLPEGGRGAYIRDIMAGLSARLRDVRIACGDFERVLGPSVTHRHGVTGVFLDPPYEDGEHGVTYSGGGGAWHRTVEWCVANGDNEALRIVLCGYDTGEDILPGWRCAAWKARGGYGSQGSGRGRDNAKRERLWMSPACIDAREPTLL